MISAINGIDMTDVVLNIFYSLGTISLGICFLLYMYFKYSYKYWNRKGVHFLEPSFPFGNIKDLVLMKKSIGIFFRDVYNQIEGKKFCGVYGFHKPIFVIRDPDLIKSILVKDFIHFNDHGIIYDEKSDPLSGHLFMLTGKRWKNLRAKLTPTFSSSKMKMMFSTLLDCGDALKAHVVEFAHRCDTLEIKDLVTKYTTDVIASCAFGIQCNCLQNPDAEFRTWGRKIFRPSLRNSIRDFVFVVSPAAASLLKIPFAPKDVTQYFITMVRETVNYREKNKITRNDFFQLLMQLKNQEFDQGDPQQQKQMNNYTSSGYGEKAIRNIEDLAAQVFVFYKAGLITSSTTMSFCLYELALHPDIQLRVQAEIDSVLKKHGNKVTYESIQEMEYLDRVVAETMRMYPPLPVLNRVCTKSYEIPQTSIVLEKGTYVMIPILGIQHDPKYYPNPSRFDPDRFLDENKNKRHHFTYLPFGEGPRICIARRFGLMETKVGLVSLLSNNSFRVCEKTPVPLKVDTKSVIMASAGGMWLQIVKR